MLIEKSVEIYCDLLMIEKVLEKSFAYRSFENLWKFLGSRENADQALKLMTEENLSDLIADSSLCRQRTRTLAWFILSEVPQVVQVMIFTKIAKLPDQGSYFWTQFNA